MSELAFNVNGESFEVPATVTGWRVRRMKPRGAPELVYGRDGHPLTIPIEANMDDLREAAGALGKYRLDPIDEDGKVVEGVPAAYVQVFKPEYAEATPVVTATGIASDDTIREAMRLNTELARAVIDRFPEMMHAAAVLLHAADGAGLPLRLPLAPPAVPEDGDEEEEPAPPAAPGGFDLNAIVAQVMSTLVTSLASGDLKLPGLGALLDWRKAVPKAIEAPKPPPRRSEPRPTAEPSKPAKPADVALPALDPATLAHFAAVQAALTPEERALAREAASDLSPAEVRAWFDELSKLSVADAAERIRKIVSATKGAVS